MKEFALSNYYEKVFSLSLAILLSTCFNIGHAQKKKSHAEPFQKEKIGAVKYGTASFYAKKFHGRQTSSGKIYNEEILSAACNAWPLNSWIKVTNLKNNKTVIVQIIDRLHPKNKRLVDLSKLAATRLDYLSQGIIKVKVEVLNNFTPESAVL